MVDQKSLLDEENFTQEQLEDALTTLGCLLYARRQRPSYEVDDSHLDKSYDKIETLVNKMRFREQ